jgi:hypothetical protein
MTQRVQSFHWYAVRLVLVALLALSPLKGSQQPPDAGGARIGLEGGLSPSLLQNGPLGELLSIYPPRKPEEVQKLIGLAHSEQESAQKDIAESRRIADAADGRVRIMNEEVKTTETRLSVAKKEKSASDRNALESELKRQKAELKYIERVRDAYKSDAALLDSRNSAASARVKALELEADVSRKYDVVAGGSDSASDIAGYRDALKKMLAARQEAADRVASSASSEKDVATRRLKQLDALAKINR